MQDYLAWLSSVLSQVVPGRTLEPSWVQARALWLFSATHALVLTAQALGSSERDLVALAPTMAALLLRGLEGA